VVEPKTQEIVRPGLECAAPQTPFASRTLTWTESDAPSCSTVHAALPTWTQPESKPSFPPASGGFGGMARDRANLRGTAVLPHTTEGCGEQTLHPPEKGTTRTEAIRAERFFKARQIRRQSRILSMICRAIGRILASTLAARLVCVQDTRLCIYESIAKRLFHRRDAAFAEEDAMASRSNVCFATHTFRFLDSLYARRLSGASLLVKSYMVQVRERTGCTYDASPGWRPRAVNSAPSFCSPRRTRVLIVPSGRFSFVAISWCDNPPKYASSTASRCVSGR
jgi:hypothetical protein